MTKLVHNEHISSMLELCESVEAVALRDSAFVAEYSRKFAEQSATIAENTEHTTCLICQSNDDDNKLVLTHPKGTHIVHAECIRLGVKSYIDQNRVAKAIICPEDSCGERLSVDELVFATADIETAARFQRALIRSIPGLHICPRCHRRVAKENDLLGLAYNCPCCRTDVCFGCGLDAHVDVSCQDIQSAKGSTEQFMRSLIRGGEAMNYGLCPRCRMLIEKQDGCNRMVCGQNAPDKDQLTNSDGCGLTFEWESRILLTKIYPDEIQLEIQRENCDEVVIRDVIWENYDLRVVYRRRREERRIAYTCICFCANMLNALAFLFGVLAIVPARPFASKNYELGIPLIILSVMHIISAFVTILLHIPCALYTHFRLNQ